MWQYFVIIAALYMLGVAIYDMVALEDNKNGMIVNGVTIGIAGGLLVFAGQSLVTHSKNKGNRGHGDGHGDKGRDKGRDKGKGDGNKGQGDKKGGKR